MAKGAGSWPQGQSKKGARAQESTESTVFVLLLPAEGAGSRRRRLCRSRLLNIQHFAEMAEQQAYTQKAGKIMGFSKRKISSPKKYFF